MRIYGARLRRLFKFKFPLLAARHEFKLRNHQRDKVASYKFRFTRGHLAKPRKYHHYKTWYQFITEFITVFSASLSRIDF